MDNTSGTWSRRIQEVTVISNRGQVTIPALARLPCGYGRRIGARNMELDRYTEEQKQYIRKLRERMTGFMPQEMYEDDSVFMRFLVARNYDLNAAEAMLKANVNWRNINKIDSLLTDYDPPEVALKYIPANHLGFTKEGYPITLCRFGNIDFKGLLKSIKKSDVALYVAYVLEREISKAKIKSKELGKPIDRYVFIFDLSNFAIATATYKPALDVMILLVSMFDSNYPERLKCAFICNASFYFTLFWAVLSPFLAGETFKKVKVYGKDKDSWLNDFQNEMDLDILPAFIGGNLTDPDGDPSCKTLITQGGMIPEKHYCRRDNSFRKRWTTKKVVIHRMSKERVAIEVDKPGSLLEWEFEVKNRDIGFSVLFKDTENVCAVPKEEIPHQRIETVISSETGLLRCVKAGIYILEFDNTYSWMHSKEIYYKTSVMQSDQVFNEL